MKKFLFCPIKVILAPEAVLSVEGLKPALHQFPGEDIQIEELVLPRQGISLRDSTSLFTSRFLGVTSSFLPPKMLSLAM